MILFCWYLGLNTAVGRCLFEFLPELLVGIKNCLPTLLPRKRRKFFKILDESSLLAESCQGSIVYMSENQLPSLISPSGRLCDLESGHRNSTTSDNSATPQDSSHKGSENQGDEKSVCSSELSQQESDDLPFINVSSIFSEAIDQDDDSFVSSVGFSVTSQDLEENINDTSSCDMSIVSRETQTSVINEVRTTVFNFYRPPEQSALVKAVKEEVVRAAMRLS